MQKIGWTTPSLSICFLNGRCAQSAFLKNCRRASTLDIFKNLRFFDWNIMAGLGPDFRIFKSGSGPDFIYLVCVIYCCVWVRNWILSNKSGNVSGSGFYQHLFSWTCKVFGPGFGPDFSLLFPANTVCVRSFANGTDGTPMPSEVLPLAVIRYH